MACSVQFVSPPAALAPFCLSLSRARARTQFLSNADTSKAAGSVTLNMSSLLVSLCCSYWDDDGNYVKHDPDLNEHHDVYGEYDHHFDDHGNPMVMFVDTDLSALLYSSP